MNTRFSSRMQRGRVFLSLSLLLIFAPVAQGQTRGANPRSNLTLGPDGNFYSTTFEGGEDARGTVFRITPAGKLNLLHRF